MTTRTTGHFDGFALEGFWDDHEYYATNYTEPAPSEELIAEIEAELGYRLPDAYVELVRLPGGRNGGGTKRCCYPLRTDDPNVIEVVMITGIYAIGRTSRYSLLGALGGTFMVTEWGYPPIGVYFADTPSAGHEMLALDYRACGPQGEPSVVHVDQEGDYRITEVAPDFASFVRGLLTEEDCHEDDDEAELEEALLTVERGTLSPILRRALDAVADELPNGEALIRSIGAQIVREKGHFSLHDDGNSWQLYDTLFWLYSQLTTATSFEEYFNRADGQTDYERPCHVLMLRSSFTADPYGFCTEGYAEGFVRDWWQAKLDAGAIVRTGDGYRFAPDYERAFLRVLRARNTA